VYGFAPFMVIASALGEPQRLYRGIYTIEKYTNEFITQYG
jgi:hypothetical protein